MKIYDFTMNNIDGEPVDLSTFAGKVLLIVNTASKCGFTPQFDGLQKLYETYNDRGLEILGFPSNQFNEQDPGENAEIKNFCMLNYGVDFTMFEKIDVRGETAHPLYQYLTSAAPHKGFDLSHEKASSLHSFLQKTLPKFLTGNDIKWNFTKFLIDRNGTIVKRYESYISPESMAGDIEALL